jgi:uncharacterized protein with PIN domain
MAWLSELHALQAEAAARATDPWRVRLERLHGRIGDDGIERISTQAVFDFLEVLQRSRGAGASRRLARLMRELGWTPVRVRDLTRGGYKEQVRGYCREVRATNGRAA